MPSSAAIGTLGPVKKLFQNARAGPCSLQPKTVQRTRPLSSWVRDSASGVIITQRSWASLVTLSASSGDQ